MTTKKDAAGDVAEQVKTEQDQGFVGDEVDREPNSTYSMEGGAPKKKEQS
jgi:hypothetical protein